MLDSSRPNSCIMSGQCLTNQNSVFCEGIMICYIIKRQQIDGSCDRCDFKMMRIDYISVSIGIEYFWCLYYTYPRIFQKTRKRTRDCRRGEGEETKRMAKEVGCKTLSFFKSFVTICV